MGGRLSTASPERSGAPARSGSTIARLADPLPAVVVHAACACVVSLVLAAAGQPILTDDLWWHLAMGRLYAAVGPWLDADPFLFAAERAPEPAAWLAAVVLHGVEWLWGFQGLRVFHVAVVGAILGLAWSLLRRVGGSAIGASLGTTAFAALAAYRLFQLRPHLFTVALTLIVLHGLVVERRAPTRGRVLAVAVSFAVWANLHGAFVVGLALIGGAVLGLGLEAAWNAARGASRSVARLWSMVGAGIVATLATALNPEGPRFLLLYLTAGGDTPDLDVVADEWAGVHLFAAPLSSVPPSPLSWGLVWALLIGTPIAVAAALRARGEGEAGPGEERATLDPALLGAAAVAVVGMLSAVRLLWLGLLPMLVCAQAARVLAARRRPVAVVRSLRLLAAGAAAGLAVGFATLGDWPMISRGLSPATYAAPYATSKYHAHGVWFLDDAGLRGRLYGEYWLGNFLGYWLAPDLKMMVNGSLNVPKEVMAASRAIRARRPDERGRTVGELLDLYRVDVFLGTGMPVVPMPGRPVPDTTRHLEATPGWTPVFRNLQTAVYVRDSSEGRADLERAVRYYAEQDVPFDPVRGFDPLRVLQEAPEWAIAHGVAPADLAAIERSAPVDRVARARLASMYALLGVYDRAIEIDEGLVAEGVPAVGAARRLVWSLLHAGRIDALAPAIARLEARARPGDILSERIVAAARAAQVASVDERAAILAALPLFSRPQGQIAVAGFVVADPRPARP